MPIEEDDAVAEVRLTAAGMEDVPLTARERGYVEELELVYGLLEEAVPLALLHFQAGGVRPFEQWAFWTSFLALEKQLGDVGVELPDLLSEDRPNPFRERADTYMDLRVQWERAG